MSTDLQERPPSPEGGDPKHRKRGIDPYLRDRILLPLGIIALAGLIIVAVILNVSRIFLANAGESAAVLCGTVAGVGFVLAIWAAVQPGMHSSQAFAIIGALSVALILTGLALIDPAEETGGESGPVVASAIEVDAHNFGFQENGVAQTNAEAPGLEISYVSEQGSHTLVFEGVADFKLAADTSAGQTGVVELAPGEYVYYCDIPGHRQNGMEATLVVNEAPPGTLVGAEGETSTTE